VFGDVALVPVNLPESRGKAGAEAQPACPFRALRACRAKAEAEIDPQHVEIAWKMAFPTTAARLR
jgi:hypothetical protein